MKIFISWSGEKSHLVALELKTWLPSVIQALDTPWVSSEDIESGANWSATIGAELDACRYGIVCVTQQNQTSQWLNFEAGAISRLVGNAAPLLIDFTSAGDLTGPLTQLQVTMPTKDGVRKLLGDINRKLAEQGGRSLDQSILDHSFESNWPAFESALQSINLMPTSAAPPRSTGEKLDEVLDLLRNQQRDSTPVRRFRTSVVENAQSLDRRLRAIFEGTGIEIALYFDHVDPVRAILRVNRELSEILLLPIAELAAQLSVDVKVYVGTRADMQPDDKATAFIRRRLSQKPGSPLEVDLSSAEPSVLSTVLAEQDVLLRSVVLKEIEFIAMREREESRPPESYPSGDE